jgi:hypothetical protein
MKTALMVMFVVVVYTVVVILALPVFIFPVLDRFGFAESWVVGAIFNSWLLFWSCVLFTGLVLAVVIVVGWRILKGRCVAFTRGGESRGQDRGA